MTVAMSVLVGSAVRTLPAPWSAAVPGGGLAIFAGAWAVGGFSPVAAFNGVGWLAGLAVGLYLRLLDRRRVRADARRRSRTR
jgi:membrane associated rhomboid family serine protease